MPAYSFSAEETKAGRLTTRVRIDGRRVRFTGTSYRDLGKQIEAARGDATRGTFVNPNDSQVTFREFADEWLAGRMGRPGTVDLQRNSMHKHWYPRIGDNPLAKLRPVDLQRHVVEIFDNGAGLAASTLRHQTVPHLRQVLNAAVENGNIPKSPAAKLTLPEVPHTEVQIPTVEEVETITRLIDPRSRALVVVGAGLGLRQGEVFGLAWADIGADGVNIARQLQLERKDANDPNSTYVPRLVPPKGKRSYRTVPLPRYVADALEQHRRDYPNDDPDGSVFVSSLGGKIRRNQWNRRAWKPAVEEAQVPDMGFHALRHFYASALIRDGHSATEVAKRLGNTASQVQETYAHEWPDSAERTVTTIDRLFHSRHLRAVGE